MGLPVCWLVEWLGGWLAGWFVGWLGGWLVGWLGGLSSWPNHSLVTAISMHCHAFGALFAFSSIPLTSSAILGRESKQGATQPEAANPSKLAADLARGFIKNRESAQKCNRCPISLCKWAPRAWAWQLALHFKTDVDGAPKPQSGNGHRNKIHSTKNSTFDKLHHSSF